MIDFGNLSPLLDVSGPACACQKSGKSVFSVRETN